MVSSDEMKEIQKDIRSHLSFTYSSGNEQEWLTALSYHINELIAKDFQKLVEILYRLDISEDKIRQILNDQKNEPSGRIIATLIIERQKEKLISRKKFRQDNKNINESEKW